MTYPRAGNDRGRFRPRFRLRFRCKEAAFRPRCWSNVSPVDQATHPSKARAYTIPGSAETGGQLVFCPKSFDTSLKRRAMTFEEVRSDIGEAPVARKADDLLTYGSDVLHEFMVS